MNTLSKKIGAVLIGLLAMACEDVIPIDVPSSPEKLVIDASINWVKGTTGNFQIIKLSLTAPYFDRNILPANDAEIIVTDSQNHKFIFNENEDTGIYVTYNFIPKLDEVYTLTISYQNNIYVGTEVLKSVNPITRVAQENDKGFSGDETEIKAFYQDPENEDNYYFFEFINDKNALVALEIYDDEFTNGNEIFGYFSDEDLNPGDKIIIIIHGVSKRFYEFMFILLQQKTAENGSPFETQPTSIRGNCVNITNPDNHPFGYFRLSEADQFVYTIE